MCACADAASSTIIRHARRVVPLARQPRAIHLLTRMSSSLPAAPTEAPRLLHADEALLLLDKPAGLLAVAGKGETGHVHLARWVQQRWPEARVVHRLDMATSGLMLFARSAAVQADLGTLFASRSVHKDYLALVHGHPAQHGGDITLPLGPDWPRRPRQQVDLLHGKPAHTRWQVLQRSHDADGRPVSRLALQPLTGRTHQLRVHLLALGHAIVGDRLYAPDRDAAPRLMLHAQALALVHPLSGQPCHFRCDAPF